jgi:hypothetical protein
MLHHACYSTIQRLLLAQGVKTQFQNGNLNKCFWHQATKKEKKKQTIQLSNSIKKNLLHKLIVTWLVNKLLFMECEGHITTFTWACHSFLSWSRCIQQIPFNSIKILKYIPQDQYISLYLNLFPNNIGEITITEPFIMQLSRPPFQFKCSPQPSVLKHLQSKFL